jgi:ADP-heptose:LPS heptosyltransferase
VKILVARYWAMGDVIQTTPIVRELRCIHPNAQIDYQTAYPAPLIGNQDISNIVRSATRGEYDLFVDLNLMEWRLQRHIIDTYSEIAFGYQIRDKTTRIEWSREDQMWVAALLPQLRTAPKSIITVHATRSWPTNTLPAQFWANICEKLAASGFSVCVIGTRDDIRIPEPEGVTDLVGLLSVNQLACLFSQIACHIGFDTGTMHVAGATNVPIVAIFNMTPAEYVMPYRQGRLGLNVRAIIPTVECYGCLHGKPCPRPPPRDCERGDLLCLTQIEEIDVAEVAIQFLSELGIGDPQRDGAPVTVYA